MHRERRRKISTGVPVACAVSSSVALGVKSLTELGIKCDLCNSQCSYLEVDLLGQLFSLVVLSAGVTVGCQSQEGRAHGAAARLTAEVLRSAGEQTVNGEVVLSFYNINFKKSFETETEYLMNDQVPPLYCMSEQLLHK